MHPQIIKVDDIHQSIKDVGLEYYADRLIQDDIGDYYYIDATLDDKIISRMHREIDDYWTEIIIGHKNEPPLKAWYRVISIPYKVAWFIIDALKLQQQILGIGTGEYEGLHGGRISVFIPPNTEFKCEKSDKPTEIPAKLGRIIVEDL